MPAHGLPTRGITQAFALLELRAAEAFGCRFFQPRAGRLRQVLFFIHIPKTAGISFRRMLWRNLRTRLIEVPHVFLEDAIGWERIRKWMNSDAEKLAVASHRLSLDLPLRDCETFSGYAIAVIRNPADWISSHFHYTRKPGIISYAQTNPNQFSSFDSYIAYLANRRNEVGFKAPSQAKILLRDNHANVGDVETLLVKQRLFLLPQELLLEGVTALSMRFPKHLRDPSLEQVNVNKRSRHPMNPETRKLVSELLSVDHRLYALAEANLKTLLAGVESASYTRKLRAVRLKSEFRNAALSGLQAGSERVSNFIRSL